MRTYPGYRQFGPRHAEGDQQAQPQRHSLHLSPQEHTGQEAHHSLRQIVAEVHQGVGPGVHPQKDHGIVLVPGGVEEVRVHVRAHQGQKQQDVQKGLPGRHHGMKIPRCQDHQEEVKELEKKDGDKFPENRQHIGKDLEAFHLINGGGQQMLHQRDLPDGVEDAVDPVSIFQGKGYPQCIKHRSPLSAPR